MNKVLGNKPATRPPIVINTLEDDGQTDEEVKNQDGPVDVEVADAVVDHEKMVGECENDGHKENADEKLKSGDLNVEQVENKTDVKKERQIKKRRTREDRFEKAMNVIIEKLTKDQKESDEMFISLEEKRMRLKERMMEMEDCRLREHKIREERQKRDEREFQLRMMTMMMRQQGGMTSPLPPFTPNYDYTLHCSSSSSQQWSE